MLIPDVNVYLGAHRVDDPHHTELTSWLGSVLAGDEPVGVSGLVLSAVVRIATNHRIYRRPATAAEVLDFCAVVRGAPAAVPITPSPRHWQIFDRLVRETSARGNTVPDAYLAAFAVQAGATFVTRDRGLRRFPGLHVLDPVAD